jgi:hypothetical protein
MNRLQNATRKPSPTVAKPRSLFHAVENRRFGRSICFLCGKRLSVKTRTDEHIFPKWLQYRFSLWNRQLTLLNGTNIPYRRLTIPCCRECNTIHLSAIEDKVSTATLKGPKAVAALDALTLFLWLSKIFYGLLYKEFFLVSNRKSGRRTPIVGKRALKAFALHHLFLQAARVPFRFEPAIPASIFIFRVTPPRDMGLRWDFRDCFRLMTVACRVGNVGILAALQDGGAQRDSKSVFWRRYQKFDLHPLHFTELSAAFFYSVSLVNRVPGFLTFESNDAVVVAQNPLQGFSLKPIFDDWNQERFARLLSQMIGLPFERIFIPPTGVASWLHDARGRVHPRRIDGAERGRFDLL